MLNNFFNCWANQNVSWCNVYKKKIFVSPVPCAPQNVSATLVCLNHSALVSWIGSPSAVGYNVTLKGQDGHTHHCQTNSTSCQLPDIHCGETYGITVTPYSETCAGHSSAVFMFRAGKEWLDIHILAVEEKYSCISAQGENVEDFFLSFSPGVCAPSNITVYPVCEDSIVSWSQVPGAEVFIAKATADDGHTHTCSSNHSNSCNFTDLHCGETYAVTVVTVDRGCWSEPSSAVELRTGERSSRSWMFKAV